ARIAVAPAEVAEGGLLHRGAQGDRDATLGDAELTTDPDDQLRVALLLGVELHRLRRALLRGRLRGRAGRTWDRQRVAGVDERTAIEAVGLQHGCDADAVLLRDGPHGVAAAHGVRLRGRLLPLGGGRG